MEKVTRPPKARNNNREEKRVFALLKQGLATALKNVGKVTSSVLIQCGDETLCECNDVKLGNNQRRADFVFTLNAVEVGYITHKASDFYHNGYGSLWRKCWSERGRVIVCSNSLAMLWTRDWCVNHCYKGEDREGLLDWLEPCPEGIWFIPGPDLQRAIVYGPKYGSDKGPDNVHFLAVGDPEFSNQGGGTLKLNFSEGLYPNGVIPTGPNTPIVVVKKYEDTKSKKRRFYTQQFPLKGMRADFGYFPLRLIEHPKHFKVRGCKQVQYPSGHML